ncbi:MAG: VCBS domain-containing protein [Desulfovibrio sp.]|jgi:VCBS repeat-containing protein|nr:VCBS domain-containing protein [Desulfovibrio sp.]
MADITLTRPAQGQTRVALNAPDSRIVLNFPASQATMDKVDDNLVFSFDDGASLVLENFYQQYNAESIPEFEVEGQVIAGADFFSAFGPDIAPAAGAGATGGGRYNEYTTGELAGGLDHLNELDYRSDREGVTTETEDYVALPPTGISISWNDAWAGGSGVEGPDGSILASAANGVFTLSESGLPGGTRAVDGPIEASSTLRISTENSNFAGMTIDGEYQTLAELAGGVDVPLDQDGDGETDVSVSFRYVGDNSVSVTVTLDNTVSHLDGLGNALENALADLALTAHDDQGNSAAGALNVVVVDDAPIAYDNAAAAGLTITDVSGNVVTDDDGQGSDKFGADGEATDRVDWVNAAGQPDIKLGDTELTRDPVSGKLTDAAGNDYGTLELDETTGQYTYTKPEGATFEGDITVAYTIEDKDGDRASATLTIAVTDAGVSIGDITGAPGAGADATVQESGLPGGTTEGDGSEKTGEQSFTITAPDGLAGLTIGGVAVNLADPAGTQIQTDLGTLTITGVTGDAQSGYTVEYKYTLEKSTTDVEDKIEKDSFTVAVTDSDGDTSEGTLSIAIQDDAPIANNDTAGLELSATSVTGNVLVNDKFGADGEAADKVDWVNADGNAEFRYGDKFGDTVLNRAADGKLTDADNNNYGTLILDETTGQYTYTKPLDSAVDLEGDLTVVYTIEDKDGDRASAKLTINVTDRDISIGGTTDAADGEADAIVSEAFLTEGGRLKQQDAGSRADEGDSVDDGSFTSVAKGNFTISAPDGLAGLTIGGVIIDLADPAGTPPIQTDLGTLEVTGIDGDAQSGYTVAYKYTLEHSTTDVEGVEKDSFTVAVTDSDGDTSNGTLSIAIQDDAPTGRDDYRSLVLEGEDGANAAVVAPISGNVISGMGTDAKAGADVRGADGSAPGSVSWDTASVTTDNEEQVGHAEQGFDTSFSLKPVDGQDGVFTVVDANSAAPVGEIRLQADGTYEFKANAAYEPEHGDHTINIPYTFKDKDGDEGKAELHITIRNVNDKPVFDLEGGLAATGAVKEDGVYAAGERTATLTTAENDTPTKEGEAVAGEHKLVTEGRVSATDADGDLLTFGLQNGQTGQYPDTGAPCVVLQGAYGNLYLQSDGEYTYVLDPGKANSLGEGRSAQENFTVTATDNSGAANAVGTATIRITVHGSNEAPTLAEPAKLVVTEAGGNTTAAATFSIPLQGHDVDAGDTLTYSAHLPGSAALVGKLYLTQGDSGPEWTTTPPTAATRGTYYGEVNITSGKAEFKLYNDTKVVQEMDTRDEVEIVHPVVAQDQHGDYAEQEVPIVIKGTNDAPVVSGGETAAVKDDGVYAPNRPASGWGDDAFIHAEENTATTDGNADAPNGPVEPAHHEFTVTGSLLDRVTDVDDVVGGPANEMTFTLNGGVTLKNNAGQTVSATLADPDGDGVYNVVVGGGVIGQVSLTPDGNYVFTLNPAAGYVNGLAEGEKSELKIEYKVSDGENAATGALTVTIKGTNDLPELTLDPDGNIENSGIQRLMEAGLSSFDDADAGQAHGLIAGYFPDEDAAGQTARGVFRISDADTSDMKAGHDIRVTSVNTNAADTNDPKATGTDLAADANDNVMVIKGEYGDLYITRTGSATDHTGNQYSYEYRLDPARAGKLDAGEAGYDDFSVAIRDQFGAHDSQTLTFAVTGSEDPTQIDASLLAPDGPVVEDGVGLPVNTRGMDNAHTHEAQYGDANAVGKPMATGLIGALDEDVSDQAALGLGGPDAKLHYVIVVGGKEYDLNVELDGKTEYEIDLPYGTLSVTAGDGSAPFKYVYTLDNDNPDVQKMQRGEQKQDEFTVRIVEDGTELDSSAVRVTITGANDRPLIDIASGATAMSEDAATASGRIQVTDYEQLPDQYNAGTGEWDSAAVNSGFRFSLVQPLDPGAEKGDLLAAGQADDLDESKFNLGSDTFLLYGKHGYLELNSQTGEYTYHRTENLNYLNNGESVEEVFYVRVLDADGAYSEIRPVIVTINGADDAGSISGAVTMREDGVTISPEAPEYQGVLHYDEGVADDNSDTPAPGYHLGANAPDAGSHAQDTQIVGRIAVSDPDTTDQPGHGATYTFATNDNPIAISGNTATAVESDAAGNLADLPEATGHGTAVGGYHTAYGDIALYADGYYTFTPARDADGNLADVINNLALGETVTIRVPVTATNTTGNASKGETAGGHITITIEGTNDAPVFTSDADEDLEKINLWQIRGDLSDNVRDADHGAELTFFVVQDTDAGTDNDNHRLDGNVVQSIEGEYGTLTVQRDGTYTYTLKAGVDANGLPADATDEFKVFVRDEHNAVSETSFPLTIDMDEFRGSGTNPWVGPLNVADGAGVAEVVEDRKYTDSGDLDEGMPSDGNYDDNLTLVSGGEHVRSVSTEYGTMTLLPNGEWQYTLNNDHPDVQRLQGPEQQTDVNGNLLFDTAGNPVYDEGTAQTITQTFTTSYGTTITVTITGTNDAPVVTASKGNGQPLTQSNTDGDDSGAYMDWSATSVSGTFTAVDLDNREADSLTLHTYRDAQNTGPEVTHNDNGTYTVEGQYGTYTITPEDAPDGEATFSWTYTLNPDLPDYNGSYKDTVTLSVSDGHGGFAPQELSVVLSGTNTNPVLNDPEAAVAQEDTVLSVTGRISAVDTDIHIGSDLGGRQGQGDTLAFSALSAPGLDPADPGSAPASGYVNVVAGQYGTLFLNKDGSYEYKLNNANPDVQGLATGETANDVFWVRVSDGQGGHDYQPFVVTVQGTDGAPMLSLNDLAGHAGQGASLYVTEADGRTESYKASGKAAAYDEDDMDQGNLSFSFGDGNDALADNPTSLFVHADGSTGTDALPGDLGTLVMAGDGTYTFTGNPEAIAKLEPGEKVEVDATVVVADLHGNTDEAPLKITITGTNTTPEITFEQAGVTEGDKAQGDFSFIGTYAAPDADGHETSLYIKTDDGYVTTLEGEYGKLTLNGDGTYTYTLHNAQADVQALNTDKGATDAFVIVVRDEYGAERLETLNVDIAGTNDNPVISVQSDSTVTPSATDDKGFTGKLTVTDVDDEQGSMTFAAAVGDAAQNDFTGTTFGAATGVQTEGSYGSLTLGYDGNGNLTYTYIPKADAVNALEVNKPVNESFTIAVRDGHGGTTEQTITVKVTNTNDGPVLSLQEDVDKAGYGAAESAGRTQGTDFDQFFVKSDQDAQDVSGLTYRVDGASATTAMEGYTHEVAGKNGTLYYNSGDGTNLYVPNGNVALGDTAADTFTVWAVDGHGAKSNGITLAVSVSGENSAPTLSFVSPASVNENSSISGTFGGADVDGNFTGAAVRDVLTYSVAKAVETTENPDYDYKVVGEHGTLYYNSASGAYRYEATDESLGAGVKEQESFAVRVSDGKGGVADQTLTVNVTGANDAPVVDAAYTTDLTGEVSFSDDDTVFDGAPDAHSLVISYGGTTYPVQLDESGNGTCAIAGVGTFTLTPAGDGAWDYDFAPDAALTEQYREGTSNAFTFKIGVSDGRATGWSEAQKLIVTGTNEAPEVALIPDADAAHSGTFTVTDSDATTLTVKGTEIGGTGEQTIAGEYGTLTVDPAGAYSYASKALDGPEEKLEEELTALDEVLRDEGNALHDSFVFSATDGKGAAVTETLNITLAAQKAGGDNSEDVLELQTDAEHILLGGGGDDTIAGGGDTILYGGAGDDTFNIGGGYNGAAYGGAGNDIFVISGAPGADARVDGGEGVDFLLGMEDMSSVEAMLESGKLHDVDVVVIGQTSAGTDTESLADYGITLNGNNKVVLDGERWTQDNSLIENASVLENYNAYTTTGEEGDSLTLLVAKVQTETTSS